MAREMQKNGMYIQQNDSGFGIHKTLLMMMVEKKELAQT